MDIKELIAKLSLQEEVKEKVISLILNNSEEYSAYINDLINLDTSESTYQHLAEKYSNDVENYNILAIYLIAALKVYEKYQEMNISLEIFIDTMKCIKRFIDECKIVNGKYYFDRPWWVYRQLRMSLFRIGQLEYEFDFEKEIISIHIPSDAILSSKNIELSIEKAQEFINCYYPQYRNWEMFCRSWLLSPNLKKYLNDNSKILLFQSYFDIIDINEDDCSFLLWLFKVNGKPNYNDLMASTSLQIKVKEDLLKGEKIGSASGKLNYRRRICL